MSSNTKRKSDSPAEPSPKPKRKQRAVSASPKKRNRDNEEEPEVAPKKLSKKNSKSTSNLSENVPVTPSRGRGRPKKVVEPVESPHPGTPILIRPQTAQKISFKSDAITPKTKTPRTPRVKKDSDVIRSAVKSAEKSVVQNVSNTSSILDSEKVHEPKINIVLVEDEETPVHIWDQMWDSSVSVMQILLPLMTGIVLICHFGSLLPNAINPAITPDQGLASMGIAFFIILVTIFLTFIALVFPLILVSKLFTDIVTSSLDDKAKWAFKRDLHSYTTFIAITIMFLLTGVAYLHTI